MDFDAILEKVQELLQRDKRVSYRALKRRFALDDEYVEDLKAELIDAKQLATDEAGKVLVWMGEEGDKATQQRGTPSPPHEARDADRRQLTIMFCDLVGSTPLSAQLDPEDYREIMQAYQEMCGQVLARFTGHIARYEGDGILVYFGYPQAQEDAPAQAVRAGLHIIEALPSLNARFQPRFPLLQERGLQVRIGLHTGLVVVGTMGSKQYRVDIAVGETPNLAARIQGQAGPNEVVISAATYRLVEGLFECEDRGPQDLKGIASPQSVYLVKGEGAASSRFEVAVQSGLTPLVGRDKELQLLQQRWAQAQDGTGQVVLVSGEPGIGKSRLVQEFKERVTLEDAKHLEFRCSPTHQNSALYPVIENLQQLLQFQRDDSSDTKLKKLRQTFASYRFPQSDTVPLLAALLSLPHPAESPPLTFSPQKQKEKTQELLLRWLVEASEKQAVYCTWEDLHWADPSTLELLTLYLERLSTVRTLVLLVFRLEFHPPWEPRASFSQLSLSRLEPQQVARLVEQITGGRTLPRALVERVAAKTDGVPLFVEELTKMVLESGIVQAVNNHYELAGPLSTLAIPSTLQDSLMARLDRLSTAKEVAQLGATIGREFPYELIHAVSAVDEATLRQGLGQLVTAELVYQRGLPPQASYLFKHALIQDTAYESLLKSTRRQLHQQIAEVLVDRFSETTETQPELVAHHYTKAGLPGQAIPYWQQAGQRASQRSAHTEAISHLTKGLELIKTLPDTPAHAHQELTLQVMLGTPLQATKGYSAPEVEQVFTRARELCRRLGETSQLFPVLFGLAGFSFVRADLLQAREFAEQCFRLAQQTHDSALLVNVHNNVLGQVLFYMGEVSLAHQHFAQGLALYDPQKHNPRVSGLVQDPGVAGHTFLSYIFWRLGYPDQAMRSVDETLALAQELSHPLSQVYALNAAAIQHLNRREALLVQERAEALITLSEKHGFPFFSSAAMGYQGWALAEQGQVEEGIAWLRQCIAAKQAIGSEIGRPGWLAWLAEALGKGGQVEEARKVLSEALERMNRTGERWSEAELYRLKGELLLDDKYRTLNEERQTAAEAEQCFHKALQVARRQDAKSLELRTATSLARLWQQQGKSTEAHELLAPVYDWFTEGFATKDLQDAKTLLEELS